MYLIPVSYTHLDVYKRQDYARCVDISTASALKQMILPGILAVGMPILIGFVLGKEALAGLLVGSLVTGVLMAIFLANSGGAWDLSLIHI